MNSIEKHQQLIATTIKNEFFKQEPKELYEPNNYIINLGGKRLRPVMVLLGSQLFDGDVNSALKPAIAVEFFHNFTLMHDDIMDSAPLRRGKETVHKKYNLNTAILSGDALMIKSYQLFENLPAELFKEVVKLFSKTAAQICDGQQYDMNFETQHNVSYQEYLDMVLLKTGVMVAASLKIGAMIAGASEEQADLLYEYGKNLGIAFQIKDDYLDVFGNTEQFGKKHAGDIFENKKTILYFIAKQKADDQALEELDFWYNIKTDNIDKVYAVEKIFRKLQIDQDVIQLMCNYSQKAEGFLERIDAKEAKKKALYDLNSFLIDRKS